MVIKFSIIIIAIEVIDIILNNINLSLFYTYNKGKMFIFIHNKFSI